MVNSNLLKGNSLEKTSLPKISPRNDNIIIPGYYNEQKTDLSITQDFLSKHSLLVGQTGSGKTNVLNFFIKHIKQKMTQNDVMIIFDTKGDFIEKFYKSESKMDKKISYKFKDEYIKDLDDFINVQANGTFIKRLLLMDGQRMTYTIILMR